MLRTQSSQSAGGLPSTPRSSTGRRVREEPDSYSPDLYRTTLPSRQVRTQKSMASSPRERSRSRQPRLTDNSRSYNERPEPSSYRKSNESSSSSGSSFLDRMKVGGYASSRTSFEDDEQMSMSKRQPDNRNRSLRDRRMAREEPQDKIDKSTSGTGDGYAIWSRVATVASTMTVSVSKAWATNIKTFAGEETPPGQESRLTRAMKTYHLEMAHDPTDLPTWLFDEHERRPPSRRRVGTHRDYKKVEKTFAEQPRPGGLRDIYEAAASTSSTSVRPERPVARSYADEGVQPSKATDRLKAMRDAKRSAFSSNVSPKHQVDERSGDARREIDRGRGRSGETNQRSVRVGLPSGPIGRSRRL